ncbi:longitudinals lacking protein, isoforms A/B/D/L isoform X3 [Harpegnathos saltator]|uniref:longitudinals lacking protein, isoforms A/B/D/L isoform X3 n=1 Tax=Harpegnathos saltator TaxID=610380 RepID=UPI000DBEDF06|nr:longitudinals lacking protein, isoforms A/B/D/L isoform X3 [Harpegnathos saltator]
MGQRSRRAPGLGTLHAVLPFFTNSIAVILDCFISPYWKRGNEDRTTMEDDQQFCLRWNNHQSTLVQNFDTLLESGTLVDCTLAAEGRYLKAHKVVLSACSPYFEGLLSEHYDKHPIFILKDVTFNELKAMMDYMYRGEVNIGQDQLTPLLKAAESLQIRGLSDNRTGESRKADSRPQKTVSQPTAPSLDIPHTSSGLTIEKNRVPRQSMAQGTVGDLPEDTASPQVSKGISSREGSQSPILRKRKRLRRRSAGEDTTTESQDASNSSDMPQQMGGPSLGITPVAEERVHADPTDSLGRSALMTQLTKPADEMLQLPLEKPEPSDNLVEPKSEYLEETEEGVEDLTLDDDMNDLNEMEQDNNRAGPSHDSSQHPAGLGAWHVTGDRSNAGGVVGSVGGAPGSADEVFLAAQEAVQAHRDSQDSFLKWSLQSHLRSADYGPKISCRHHCPKCNRSYKHRSHMTRHYRYECGTPQRFECPYCDSFKWMKSDGGASVQFRPTDAHINYIARRNDMYECPSCHNLYKWKKSMLAHLRHQCKQPPRFECTHCTMKNYQKTHIIRHLRVHHPHLTPIFFDRKLNNIVRPR